MLPLLLNTNDLSDKLTLICSLSMCFGLSLFSHLCLPTSLQTSNVARTGATKELVKLQNERKARHGGEMDRDMSYRVIAQLHHDPAAFTQVCAPASVCPTALAVSILVQRYTHECTFEYKRAIAFVTVCHFIIEITHSVFSCTHIL